MAADALWLRGESLLCQLLRARNLNDMVTSAHHLGGSEALREVNAVAVAASPAAPSDAEPRAEPPPLRGALHTEGTWMSRGTAAAMPPAPAPPPRSPRSRHADATAAAPAHAPPLLPAATALAATALANAPVASASAAASAAATPVGGSSSAQTPSRSDEDASIKTAQMAWLSAAEGAMTPHAPHYPPHVPTGLTPEGASIKTSQMAWLWNAMGVNNSSPDSSSADSPRSPGDFPSPMAPRYAAPICRPALTPLRERNSSTEPAPRPEPRSASGHWSLAEAKAAAEASEPARSCAEAREARGAAKTADAYAVVETAETHRWAQTEVRATRGAEAAAAGPVCAEDQEARATAELAVRQAWAHEEGARRARRAREQRALSESQRFTKPSADATEQAAAVDTARRETAWRRRVDAATRTTAEGCALRQLAALRVAPFFEGADAQLARLDVLMTALVAAEQLVLGGAVVSASDDAAVVDLATLEELPDDTSEVALARVAAARAQARGEGD